MSEKFDNLRKDFDEAVQSYLKSKGVESGNLEDLPKKHRVAQVNVIKGVFDSMLSNNNNAKRMLVFMTVLSDTISVTPLVGNSELKNELQKCVAKHMPDDPVAVYKLFGGFNNTITKESSPLGEWFKDHEDLGKTFTKQFYHSFSSVFQAAIPEQRKAVLAGAFADEKNAKVSDIGMMSKGASSSDEQNEPPAPPVSNFS